MDYLGAAGEERVREEGAMAPPRDGLRAHDRDAV